MCTSLGFVSASNRASGRKATLRQQLRHGAKCAHRVAFCALGGSVEIPAGVRKPVEIPEIRRISPATGSLLASRHHTPRPSRSTFPAPRRPRRNADCARDHPPGSAPLVRGPACPGSFPARQHRAALRGRSPPLARRRPPQDLPVPGTPNPPLLPAPMCGHGFRGSHRPREMIIKQAGRRLNFVGRPSRADGCAGSSASLSVHERYR